MKYLNCFLLLLSTVLVLSSCDKEGSNNYPTGKGEYTFWISSDFGVGDIDVWVGGQYVGEISHFHASGVDCGDGDANIILDAGIHSFSAEAADGTSWAGTIEVESGFCKTLQLSYNGGTSGGGGSGGGGGSTCTVSSGSWVRSSDGSCSNCGGMVISFSGGQGVITSVDPANAAGFYNGQVKWKNFDSNNCTIEVLEMPTNVYNTRSITIENSNSIIVGSLRHTR